MWTKGKHCKTLDDLRTKLLSLRTIEGGCWLYTGARFANGYGSIKYKSKTYAVHRLALTLFRDVVFNSDEQANHQKFCPNKHCFNPEHLYVGTQEDNMLDKPTTCPDCARLKRKCRPCKAMANSKFYRRHNSHRKNYGR